MIRRILYRVWAYKVGPPQSESISSSWCKNLESDEPAILITFASVADRDRFFDTLKQEQHEATEARPRP